MAKDGVHLKFFRASFLSLIALLHSSSNHGLRSIRGLFDVFGIVRSAMASSVSVKDCMGLPFCNMSSETSSVEQSSLNECQSAFSSFHL